MNKIVRIYIYFYAALLLFVFSDISLSQEKVQKIDNLINQYAELKQFNGAVLVAEDGNIVLSKGYGMADFEKNIPNNNETKFRLASVTKQFTAMLVMQLVEKGKIKLEGKLSDYLPYYCKKPNYLSLSFRIICHFRL